jgi:hypothetical protein
MNTLSFATNVALALGPTVTLVAAHAEEQTPEQRFMYRAFALVCPKAWGKADWKEPVNAVLTNADLDVAGVTLADVCKAVEFFTATTARVTYSTVHATGEPAYIIRAVGYRRGPAA